jgi:Leucine-rich repeat (LRR) protein
MGAIKKLGTALAISSLSLAMFGCSGQNNSSTASQTVIPASLGNTNKTSIKLTSIDSLTISDYSLDLCIKNTGRKYIEEINALICNNKGIQHLDGIEQLTELKTLHLNFNQIEDINPLSGLKGLNTLYLSGNKIRNVDPLSELSELNELAIQKNNVQDVSPLLSISSLKTLHIRSNHIYDLSILDTLNLEVLSGKNQQES